MPMGSKDIAVLNQEQFKTLIIVGLPLTFTIVCLLPFIDATLKGNKTAYFFLVRLVYHKM